MNIPSTLRVSILAAALLIAGLPGVTRLQADEIGPPVKLDEVELSEGVTVLAGRHVGSTLVLSTSQGLTAYPEQLGDPLWMHQYPAGRYALGLPVFGDSVAVYFIYRGKGKYGPDQSGDALLNAVDLTNGQTIWSAYLPGFLPFDRRVDGDRLYISCERVGKPLTLKEVEQRWRQPAPERVDTWILALDLASGDMIWRTRTDYWPAYLGRLGSSVFFAEHKGEGRAQQTPVSKRDFATGSLVWQSDGSLDRTDFVRVETHPRGIAALSRGIEGTVSQLLHPLTGEVMGRLTIPTGFHKLDGDTLWTLGRREGITYKRSLVLSASQWNGFVPISDIKIDLNEPVARKGWMRSDPIEARFEGELPYWAAMNGRIPREYRFAFKDRLDAADGRLYLPPAEEWTAVRDFLDFGSEWLFAVRCESGDTRWGAVRPGLNAVPLWIYRDNASQAPVWLDIPWQGRAITGFDGTVLGLRPTSGTVDPIASDPDRFILELVNTGDTFCAVTTRGIEAFGAPPPPPEPEVVEEEAPEVPVVEPPVVMTPPPPVPTPVVEPEPPREKTVNGYRIQVMYLERTSREKAVREAAVIEKHIGLKVRVEGDVGSLTMRAGAFETYQEAKAALQVVRRAGMRDAYIVKDRITMPR